MVTKIGRLALIGKALANAYRVKILQFCVSPHNISDVKRFLGVSYKTTYQHVKVLEQAKLVKTEQKIDERGKNIMVESLVQVKGDQLLFMDNDKA